MNAHSNFRSFIDWSSSRHPASSSVCCSLRLLPKRCDLAQRMANELEGPSAKPSTRTTTITCLSSSAAAWHYCPGPGKYQQYHSAASLSCLEAVRSAHGGSYANLEFKDARCRTEDASLQPCTGGLQIESTPAMSKCQPSGKLLSLYAPTTVLCQGP